MDGTYSYEEALRLVRVLDDLDAFGPQVIGTQPLGIAMPGSDIDVVCHAPDAAAFADALWMHYGEMRGFALYQWTTGQRAVVAKFSAYGWPFGLFGSTELVRDQAGWRHFVVERRLLALGGEPLRSAVMAARRRGAKTEPAFAEVLNLAGDAYAAVLDLYDCPDAELIDILQRGRRVPS